MKDSRNDLPVQVKFPLGVKLAVIIGIIVLVSLGCVTILNSHFVGQDVRITAENNNLTINSRSAATVEDKLSAVRSNVFQLGFAECCGRRQPFGFFVKAGGNVFL